ADVRDHDYMHSLIIDSDVIIPLAALVGEAECKKDELAAITTNYTAISWLTDHFPKKRIIFPNTNSGYGRSGEKICTEGNSTEADLGLRHDQRAGRERNRRARIELHDI